MDALTAIREWLRRSNVARDLASHIKVSPRAGPHGRRTLVEIEHSVSALTHWPAGWRVTTCRQHLPKMHFHQEARDAVAGAGEPARRIYCLDRSMQEVICALSFGIDDRPEIPVMLGAIAMRIDANAHPDLYDRSRGGALVLLAYLRVVAERTRRDPVIHIEATDSNAVQELEALGFEPARRPPGVAALGTHLRWRLPQ